MGGKSQKEVIIGYWYALGVQAAICHVGVDNISQILIGGRTAWAGKITESGDIQVHKPDLFGGEKREGGVMGRIAVCMGLENQNVDRYVLAMRGDTSAQRGICTLVFGDTGATVVSNLSSINFAMTTLSPNVERQIGLSPTGILTTLNADMTHSQCEQYIGNFHTPVNTTHGNKPYDELAEQYKIHGTWRTVALVYAYRCFVVGNLADRQNRNLRFTREDFFAQIEYEKSYQNIATKPFWWTAMNPYFKPFWVRVQSIFGGWTRGAKGKSGCWFPEKAAIPAEPFKTDSGEYLEINDMNPAHIIYKILTNQDWGMGYNDSDIDDASFRKAAERLYSEKFGLSFAWQHEEVIEEFINIILKTINAMLRINVISGKFELILIRNDYDIDSLPILNENNIISVDKFERSAWGETPNEIVMRYKDRMEESAVVTVQNIAAIETQGSVISAVIEYAGIHEPELAARVAQRELNTISTPLAKVSLKVNRVAFLIQTGDVFRLQWEALGIESLVLRVGSINKGTYDDGTIQIEAMEDAFSMPHNTYLNKQDVLWTDPYNKPVQIENALVWEAPYYDIVQRVGEQAMTSYTGGFTFTRLFVENQSSNSVAFQMMRAKGTDDESSYQPVGKSSPYQSSFRLLDVIDKKETRLTVTNLLNLPDPIPKNGYIVLDNEVMAIKSINVEKGIIVVGRGNLDTLPEYHYPNTRGWIVSPTTNADTQFHAQGETVYYRPLALTTREIYPLANQKAFSLRLIGRSDRPFPVANVRVNGVYLGDTMRRSSDLTLTWAGRNRKLAWLYDWNHGHIQPETGVTYAIRVYDTETNKTLHDVTAHTGHTITFPAPSAQSVVNLPTDVSGLIYHYNFNEDSPTMQFAPVGGTNNGRADMSSASQIVRSGNDKAIRFTSRANGSLPFDNRLNNPSLTIGFVINPAAASGNGVIMAFEQYNNGTTFANRKFAVMLKNNGSTIQFSFGRDYNVTRYKLSVDIDKSKGYQFVLFRANHKTGYLACWIDGVLKGQVSSGVWNENSTDFAMRVLAKPLKIGYRDSNTDMLLNVPIDDIFIYERALSDDEISKINKSSAGSTWPDRLGIEMKTYRDNLQSWQTFHHIVNVAD